MGLREAINARKGLATVLTAGVVVLAVVLSVWNQRSPEGRVSQAYFADETGKEFFADSIDRIAPFDHNGKPAYRAFVYRGSDGKPFVAYLQRYNEAAKNKLLELMKRSADPAVAGDLAEARGLGLEVKRPVDKNWVPLMGQQGQSIATHPTLPDGSTARLVDP